MVTFEGWLLKTLESSCGFLKIDRQGVIHSIPYDIGVGNFFNVSTRYITLKNLITDKMDSFPISDVFNVEIFCLGNQEESVKTTKSEVNSRLRPILSEKFVFLDKTMVFDLIFLEGMNVNYMRIMDFMEYSSVKDFKRVNFNRFKLTADIPSDIMDDAYKDYELIVNKKMEMVITDLNRNLGSETALPIVVDIKENVKEFLEVMREIPLRKLQDHWPTLINPSPYYMQPRVALKDG